MTDWQRVVLCSTVLGGAEIFALERMRQAQGTPLLHCNGALAQLVRQDGRYSAIRLVVEPCLDALASRISPAHIGAAARGLAAALQRGGVLLANLRAASIQVASAHAGRNLAFIHDNSHYVNLKVRVLLAFVVARSRLTLFPCLHSTLKIPLRSVWRRRIAIEYFAPYREIAAPRRRDAQALHMLTVGRIGPDKNQLAAVHIAVALARHFGQVHLTLLGEVVDERYLEGLSRAAAPGVELHRQQAQRSEVPAILQRHDLAVHTSLIESVPLVLFEANACGVPFFAFPAGGIAEVLPERYRLHAQPDAAALQIATCFADVGARGPAMAAEAR